MSDNTILKEPIVAKKDDPVETAAREFHGLTLIFREMVKLLRKKRSASRVLEALIIGPFEKIPLFGKEEEDLLGVCKGMMYNRAIVEQYALNEHLEQKEKEDGGNNE